jgi:hypothetical protein
VAATSDTPFRLHSVARADSDIACDLSMRQKLKTETNCGKQQIPPVAAVNHMTQSAPHFVLHHIAKDLSDLFGYLP